MEFLFINDAEYSSFVNYFKVSYVKNFNEQTNAAGNSVVDYINRKRVIDIGFIPLELEMAAGVLNELSGFTMRLNFLDPQTGLMGEGNFICPSEEIEAYTIQQNKKLYKAFTVQLREL